MLPVPNQSIAGSTALGGKSIADTFVRGDTRKRNKRKKRNEK